jgi:hypothetical protein
MSAFEWERFLQQWSQAILETMDEAEKQLLSPEVLETGWLGYPGATEAEIARAESRLRLRLPPSYRAFLKVSNGWRQTASKIDQFNHRLWSSEDIELFAVRHSQWIKAFTEQTNSVDITVADEFEEHDDQWEPVNISDDEYFVYGDEQNPSSVRPEYLRTAIEISDVGLDSIYLLNPQVVSPEGEWEAWFFADYLSGADRYRSFQAMMEAEYLNFLELQTSDTESTEAAIANDRQASTGPNVTDGSGERLRVDPQSELPTDVASITWQRINQLTIEFQGRPLEEENEYRTITRASDDTEPQTWLGLAAQPLQHWLQQHLIEAQNFPLRTSQFVNCPPETSETTTAISAAPSGAAVSASPPSVLNTANEQSYGEEEPLNLNVDLDQLAIRQLHQSGTEILVCPAEVRQTKKISLGSLNSRHPFSIEVAFHLVGQLPSSPTRPEIFYKTQIFAQNRINHDWIPLGETHPGPLTGDRSTYTATLTEKTLVPGMYRLQVITSLSGATTALSSFELPLLNVV